MGDEGKGFFDIFAQLCFTGRSRKTEDRLTGDTVDGSTAMEEDGIIKVEPGQASALLDRKANNASGNVLYILYIYVLLAYLELEFHTGCCMLTNNPQQNLSVVSLCFAVRIFSNRSHLEW